MPTETPTPLSWPQVHAWRIAQHRLAARLPRAEFVQAATHTTGLQAQLLSAAEQAAWARVEGLAAGDVARALWQERTLVKTWAMRGTLHLLAAGDLPLLVAARRALDTRNWLGYFAYFGFSAAQYAALLEAVPQVLGAEPLTREQLALALAKHLRAPAWREMIQGANWGSPLKPAAFRGDLCFGPSQGQNITFVRPSAWLGQWQILDPQRALETVARRYLAAYGPATPADFERWWWGGSGLTAAKKLFRALGDELEAVTVAGWPAYALRRTVPAMQAAHPSGTVNLLPLFDAYVVGLSLGREFLLPKAHERLVFRPQGWISAVVLVDGMIKGVWELATRGRAGVLVRPFAALTAKVKRGVAAEVERLSGFLNTPVGLTYEPA